MGNNEDSPVNDLIGVIFASGFKYLADSWQKAQSTRAFPQVIAGAAGALMLVGRHYTYRPTLQAIEEAAGYTLLASAIGTWLASNTVTIGNKAKGNIPTVHTAGQPIFAARRAAAPLTVEPPGLQPAQDWTPWNELNYTS